MELVPEPLGFPPAQVFQKARFAAGSPATAFISSDIPSEYRRLEELGAVFRGGPVHMGPITAALSEDACGSLIKLVQPAVWPRRQRRMKRNPFFMKLARPVLPVGRVNSFRSAFCFLAAYLFHFLISATICYFDFS